MRLPGKMHRNCFVYNQGKKRKVTPAYIRRKDVFLCKYKYPRPFWPGINYFKGVICGPHLLAHTWASRPALICGFLGCLSMRDASFAAQVRAL